MVINSLVWAVLAATPIDHRALDTDALEWISSQAPVVDPVNMKAAEEIAGLSAESIAGEWTDVSRHRQNSHQVTRIFVSRSMPKPDLIAALSAAQRDRNTIVVFRGLAAGSGLAGFRQDLIAWLGPFAHWSSPPQIELDPPAFRNAGIEAAPTIAIYEGSQLLAAVPGMVAADWLQGQIESGQRGLLPAQGPTVAISEPDLLEVMQARLAAFDWKRWRREQSEGLVRSMRPPELPHAVSSQTRFHVPAFEVTKDLEANGARIASAGDRINPLEHVPFSQQLLVVDATDERQVEVARQWLSDWNGPTTLLTTALPESDASDFLDKRTRLFGLPLQLYRAELGPAFGILRVPSRIRAESGRFRIDEVGGSGPKDRGDDNN